VRDGVGVERAQLGHHDGGLAGAGAAHKHDVVPVGHEPVEQVGQPRRLDGRHKQRAAAARAGRHRGGIVEARHAVVPRHHEARGRVDAVVVHAALFRERHRLPLGRPPARERGAVVGDLVDKHAAAERPHARKDKVVLEQALVGRRRAAHRLARQHALEDAADGRH
jgi:hypothetical protein